MKEAAPARDMEDRQEMPAGGWDRVIVAWILVGTPLLWGVFMTLKKALLLFK